MTTDKPLLVSGLGIGLAFGFTSRSCSSKASGNVELKHSWALCRSLLIELVVSGYPGSAAGLSQSCNFTIEALKTESLFPPSYRHIAEESKTLQHRPGFRVSMTFSHWWWWQKLQYQIHQPSHATLLIFHHFVTNTVASFRCVTTPKWLTSLYHSLNKYTLSEVTVMFVASFFGARGILWHSYAGESNPQHSFLKFVVGETPPCSPFSVRSTLSLAHLLFCFDRGWKYPSPFPC